MHRLIGDGDSTADPRKSRAGFWRIALVALGADLSAKIGANMLLRDGSAIAVFGRALKLRLIYNPGFAFDLPIPAGRFAHAAFASLGVFGVLWVAWRIPAGVVSASRYLSVLACMGAGAAGNALEILFRGEVSDFIAIAIGGGRYLTINLADVMWIGGGLCWLFFRVRDGIREQGWRRAFSPSSGGSLFLIFFPPSLVYPPRSQAPRRSESHPRSM